MDTETTPVLDLAAYLERIRYEGSLSPELAVLEALHEAHSSHIPFENLDVLLRRPIRLDLEGLQAKLVRGNRGGYCFEHNILFAAVLEHLGFHVTRLAARVRYGVTRLLPRTHMLLRVDIAGEPWLADAGFGGEGLLRPIPMALDEEVSRGDRRYRLVAEGDTWVLQSSKIDTWQDLYAFTQEPQHLVDYEVASYYVSTHPTSVFIRTLTAQRVTRDTRAVLRNQDLILESNRTEQHRTIDDPDELLVVLAEIFGLSFPPGTRFSPEAGTHEAMSEKRHFLCGQVEIPTMYRDSTG